MGGMLDGAIEKSVVFACGDHRLRAQDALIEAAFGDAAKRFSPYGGMALYLLPDAPCAAHDYVMYQLAIARRFDVGHVVEVFHGGEALCAAYSHLAAERGLAREGTAYHDLLLGLQREAAERASYLLSQQGLTYAAALYYVDALHDGGDKGRLLSLHTLDPILDERPTEASEGPPS